MRKIDLIVIHCADTDNGHSFTVKDIDAWHRERGWRRGISWREKQNPELTSIGYHYVIYLDGSIHTGRHVDEVGAHAAGKNSNSIGVCMIGRNKFTGDQWNALKSLTDSLLTKYPEAAIRGHRDLPNVVKDCPGFDVSTWKNVGPQNEHIL